MRINIFDNLLFDVCVIGAGPAGITAALELAQRGLSVALVESGDEHHDPVVQKLSDAEIATPGSHSVMAEAVRRGLGGTSALWGGRCVPLDASDYEQRNFVTESGWPFEETDLQPFYQRACELLGVGDANFGVANCASLATKDRLLSASFIETSSISSTHLERWSTAPNLWQAHKDKVVSNTYISVISGFTCVGLRHPCKDGAVTEFSLRATASKENKLIRIKADVFVLACGGIESTRLVLNSIGSSSGLKLASDVLVGRCYMGHPSGKIAFANIK